MLKKTDRVEFLIKGVIKYGVVSSVSQKTGKTKVIMDGGEQTVTASHSLFKLTDHPLAKDPDGSPMDGWSIKTYREYPTMSQETTMYEAVIAWHGKPVIRAMNDGRGGCDYFHLTGKGTVEDMRAFEEATDAWRKMHNGEYPSRRFYSEAGEQWVVWYKHYRPYGTTSAVYWERENAELSDFVKGISPLDKN